MSQVKLTLRPPPNVEFVQGYPGIPPGPSRPQAAVKGTIEVRVGQSICKAKWVRIELKKVETLPGGGQQNTFFDFVGPSPVNLWQSSEEYSMLPTQDFPFFIRIPESIPPSIALEKGAGVKYELVATVCLKGKKGFLRRGKATIQATQQTIVLDKHELHSTWPVYTQPETRNLNQEGVNLTVDRSQTCYGPGDRVSVMATLKSDSLHTVILRGFEFTLKETTIFRAGPYATGKKSAPQVKVSIIGEQKVPVNVTLYGGTQHKAELACIIPPNHTTTSLNAARHIDITYVINVKALMGTGAHLIMDLPVIVSNWPRHVSVEAVKRIGTAPSLSLGAPSQAPIAPGNNRMSHAPKDSIASNSAFQPQQPEPAANTPPVFNTAPSHYKSPSQSQPVGVDEFGYGRQDIKVPLTEAGGRSSNYVLNEPHTPNKPAERPGTGNRRPGTANSQNQNRFTVTNLHEDDDAALAAIGNGVPAPVASPSANGRNPQSAWLSAEEEKRKLYESATANVARVQGSVARQSPPPQSQTPPAATPSPPIPKPLTPPHNTGGWLSAEQEKVRLFQLAQQAANRTQTAAGQSFSYSPPATQQSTFSNRQPPYGRQNSFDAPSGAQHGRSPSNSGPPAVSAGAALYQHAISSMNRKEAEQTLPSPPPSRGGGSPGFKAAPAAYPSAEEEKAALKRYHEAKSAVDRTQGISSPPPANPVPYESLYPNNNPSRSGSYTAQPSGSPPPFSSPPPTIGGSSSAAAEKERLRRQYEAQDAASSQPQVPDYGAPPAPYSVGGFAAPALQPGDPLSEKEILRRKYEAEDAAAAIPAQSMPAPGMPIGMGNPSNAGGPPPQPPPRKVSNASDIHTINSSPGPIAGSSRILSAIEEKAMLKARYEAEERGANGGSPPPSFGSIPVRMNGTPPAPPPLAPRPPAEYIQETQAEDARVRDSVAMHDGAPSVGEQKLDLDLRPFTPFSANLPGLSETPGPPPPLPPKQLN